MVKWCHPTYEFFFKEISSNKHLERSFHNNLLIPLETSWITFWKKHLKKLASSSWLHIGEGEDSAPTACFSAACSGDPITTLSDCRVWTDRTNTVRWKRYAYACGIDTGKQLHPDGSRKGIRISTNSRPPIVSCPNGRHYTDARMSRSSATPLLYTCWLLVEEGENSIPTVELLWTRPIFECGCVFGLPV